MVKAEPATEIAVKLLFKVGDKEITQTIDAALGDPLVIPEYGFYDQLVYEFGQNAVFHSCIDSIKEEEKFRGFLRGKDIKTALELGTWKGVTALLMTYYANLVITLDRMPLLLTQALWSRYGQRDNQIAFRRVPTNEDKVKLINDLDFDFAFIDDQHDYEGLKLGFEATKKCGRVLMHDYWPAFPGVMQFINELPREKLTFNEPFVLWQK